MDKMISISEVSKLTGVTSKTLKIWDKEGKLKCAYKTIGGHRRYRLSDVEIEAIEQKERMVPNEEMVHDLISIVTCFSARLYGKRGGRKLKDTIKDLEKKRGQTSEDNYKSNTN